MPEQANPQAPVTWQAIRLSGGDALAVRASKKLRGDEALVTSLGSTVLRKYLDDVPLWSGDHVEVRQLIEYFARYLYLPRVSGSEVLVQAVSDGLALLTWSSDTFAYAESYDEDGSRYLGLRGGQSVSLSADGSGLLVMPEPARQQMDAETAVPSPPPTMPTGTGEPTGVDQPTQPGGGFGETPTAPIIPRPRRFYGTVKLDPARVGRSAQELVPHNAGRRWR